MFGGLGMGAGGWVLMMLFWVALLAVIVWAIARVVSSRPDDVREPRRSADELPPPAEAPQEILDRRLASGEIDVETYEELRSKLSSPPAVKVG